MGPAIELRPGREPALWLVHSSVGDTDCFRPLVGALTDDHRVLALPVVDRGPGQPPLADLAEIARHHAATIEAAAPAGPLRVAGWGMGGVVAAELGEQLRERGRDVQLIALIDAMAPTPAMRARVVDATTVTPNLALHLAGLQGRPLAGPLTERSAAGVLELLRRSGACPPGWREADVALRLERATAHATALFRHPQRPIGAPVLLLESSRSNPHHPKPATLGWEAFADVTRVFVPGDHFDVMTPGNVEVLAARLSDELRRLDRATSAP